MPTSRPALARTSAVVAAASAVWVVASGAVGVADAVPAVLVPVLFVSAGVLAPLGRAAPFTAGLLSTVGTLHLLGLAASAAARLAPDPTAWHVLSQLAFAAGFGVLVPLAAGYPAGPVGRPVLAVAYAVCALPLVADLAGPTPAVLQASGTTTTYGPLARLLPAGFVGVGTAVFLVPLAAVVVASVRATRGGRELRGRLTIPLVALLAVAVLLAVDSVLPSTAAPVGTALFLVAAPLVPAGLVLGARPVREADLDRAADEPAPALPTVPEPVLAVLSPREREVLDAMADGDSNGAIARRLHMSTSAVEKHTTAIFAKLGLPPDATTHRRVAAVVAYLRASR